VQDFLGPTEQLFSWLWIVWSTNTLLITIIVIFTLLLWIFRRWPDRATQTFLSAGIRVPSGKLQAYREDLAEIVANAGTQGLRMITQQQQRVKLLQYEREKVAQLIQANPKLVKEVGRALEKIEKEYITGLQSVQSVQAREVLRITAEKSINDVLHSVLENAPKLPNFSLDSSDESTRE
jgi:hypothetical protein